MDFTTLGYYSHFLPATLIAVFILGYRNKNMQISLLLISSYAFFWFASGWHVILLLISTLVDWNVSNKINSTNEISTKKRWLTLSMVINLGLLGIFKYLDLIIESLNWATLKIGGSPSIEAMGLILPVGISFYTFQTMSYTIDIYREKYKPYDNFISFACYAAFFPQLVAGPIVRADHFKEQISKPIKLQSNSFRFGITLIVLGLAKKMIIADNVAIHVDSIFIEGDHLKNTALVWWGSLAFGIQIYCDFSAYTDIAIGSAALFGIRLPENFDSPYIARSPQDFWRRWHISLSTWLRDYLYIPLGGSRNGTRKMLIALMITMLLGGLWHGASWNFVLWGFLHGILLIIHKYLSKTKYVELFFRKLPKISLFTGWAITQFMIFFTWLVFRVEDLDILIPSMKSFIGIDNYFSLNAGWALLPQGKYLTSLLVVVFAFGHLLSWKIGKFKYWMARSNPLIWGLSMGLAITGIVFLRPATTVDFIYFRF